MNKLLVLLFVVPLLGCAGTGSFSERLQNGFEVGEDLGIGVRGKVGMEEVSGTVFLHPRVTYDWVKNNWLPVDDETKAQLDVLGVPE